MHKASGFLSMTDKYREDERVYFLTLQNLGFHDEAASININYHLNGQQLGVSIQLVETGEEH